MERHPIPQNIMDVEFKLFGNLTIKQFGALFACFFIAFVVWLIQLPIIIGGPIIGFFVILGFMMAFGEVGGRPFRDIFFYFVLALFTPKRRIWKKSTNRYVKGKNLKQSNKNKDQLLENLLKRQNNSGKNFLVKEKREVDIDHYQNKIINNIDKYMNGKNSKSNTHVKSKSDLNPNHLENVKSKEYMRHKIRLANLKLEQKKQKNNSQETNVVSSSNVSPTKAVQPPPNTVYGRVFKNTRQPFANIEIDIKDKNNNLIRKINSNHDGFFYFKTPLKDGIYFISPKGENGEIFEEVKISAEGLPLNFINIVQK